MWSLASAENLCFRAWTGEYLSVIYNTCSGDTHLIESPGHELLQLLSESPRTAEMLAVELSGLFAADDPVKLVEVINATLIQLQNVGLVSDTSRC